MPTIDPSPTVLTVSQLNRLARLALEQALPVSWITGELSNFSRAASGHWYFTLKDSQALVRCAMFRTRNQFIDWQPRDGDHVEIRAQPTLYEARGEFQLVADAMRHAGQGDLFEAFLRLKSRLQAEGLFSPERKRALPTMPRCVGIITSPAAAALPDALTTLRARWPTARIVLYPTTVQGFEAAEDMERALRVASARRECDVLLLIRGGGSLEDLYAFNHEAVARAIAASAVPVVTGVGHETDFTIADFVADARAPTPTGAAQLITPNAQDLLKQIPPLRAYLRQAVHRRLRDHSQALDVLTHRLLRPSQRLAVGLGHVHALRDTLRSRAHSQLQRAGAELRRHQDALRQRALNTAQRTRALAVLTERLYAQRNAALRDRAAQLASLRRALMHLNPNGVLSRGYAIVRDVTGHIMRASAAAQPGDRIAVTLTQGRLEAEVISTEA